MGTGIVIFDGSTWEFLPNEYLSTQAISTVTSDLVYEKYIKSINELETKEVTTEELKLTRYEYSIGLDYSFSKANIAEAAAFLSEKINITPDIKTIFKIKDKTSEYSSIEYYLVDGVNSYPILPYGTQKIKNEKIFVGVSTRFEIDENQEQIIKVNGETVNISIDELNQEDINTISYYPKDLTTEYYPVNKEVKIRAILRSYDKSKAAPEILSIIVEQYDQAEGVI